MIRGSNLSLRQRKRDQGMIDMPPPPEMKSTSGGGEGAARLRGEGKELKEAV